MHFLKLRLLIVCITFFSAFVKKYFCLMALSFWLLLVCFCNYVHILNILLQQNLPWLLPLISNIHAEYVAIFVMLLILIDIDWYYRFETFQKAAISKSCNFYWNYLRLKLASIGYNYSLKQGVYNIKNNDIKKVGYQQLVITKNLITMINFDADCILFQFICFINSHGAIRYFREQ